MSNSLARYDELSLDIKRDLFARMLVAGNSPAKAYNTAFSDTLPDSKAAERAADLAERPEMIKIINKYYEDKKIYSHITRENMAVRLQRISEVQACDFYEDNGLGGFRVKPMSEWTESMREAFGGIKFLKGGAQELKINGKLESINSLMKLMGWSALPDVNTANNELSNYTDEQLKELAGDIEDAEVMEDEKES